MRTRLIQIGNSQGIRLPKTVLTEAQLEGEVEVKAEPGCIVIRSVRAPRTGWEEAARKMRDRGDDLLIAPVDSTRFDREDWKWQ